MENKIKEEINSFFIGLNNDEEMWSVETACNYLDDATILLGQAKTIIVKLEEGVHKYKTCYEACELYINRVEGKLKEAEEEIGFLNLKIGLLNTDLQNGDY